jgi:hypothetical protein
MTAWVYDDGGRAVAGFKGTAEDCVTRAIAIATAMDYRTVYKMIHMAGSHANLHVDNGHIRLHTGDVTSGNFSWFAAFNPTWERKLRWQTLACW